MHELNRQEHNIAHNQHQHVHEHYIIMNNPSNLPRQNILAGIQTRLQPIWIIP